MAIYPSTLRPQPAPTALPTGGVSLDIQAWTEEASSALDTLDIHDVHEPDTHTRAPAVQPRRSVTMEISLDEENITRREAEGKGESRMKEGKGTAAVHTVHKRSEPIRRDSLNRREALLRGKEGSRARRRWENDRLIGNPYATPPLPSDFSPSSTSPRHNPVPYSLAPLWDSHLAPASHRSALLASRKSQTHSESQSKHLIPKEFRAAMKKSKGARLLLRDLEMEVRSWVESWEARERDMLAEGIPSMREAGQDDDDEEVVFIGRNGTMHDQYAVKPHTRGTFVTNGAVESDEVLLRKELMLLQSAVDDHGASFCRYLIHHIGDYYGLSTWSVTVDGRPARREAYVGLSPQMRSGGLEAMSLPQPLWGLV